MCTIRIETLGCRLNQIESEAIASLFTDNGFSVSMEGVTSSSKPDATTLLVIINTCAVTQKAEQKARRLIRLNLKKYNNASVLVTGCYAQLSKVEIEKIDKRIIVLGGQVKSRISKIPQILKDISSKNFKPLVFNELIKESVLSLPPLKTGYPENSFKLSTTALLAHSRASLKIQDGCNNACSYCTIHIARGHSVSLDVNTVIERVKALEAAAYDEVVLTTINISQYKGLYKEEGKNEQYYDFVQLLEKLLDSSSTIIFRISSLYPQIVTDEFCSVIKDKRVRPHFHISVQSGSNKILSLMKRQYKREAVIQACNKIRMAKPEAFIACDIITGFPGETDEDFIQTYELCRACNFTWIHAFPFSERPGTAACSMKPKIPQVISGERARKLTELAIANKIEYIKTFAGQKLTAVVEKEVSKASQAPYIYHCMTENFIHCQLLSQKPLQTNKAVDIKILEPLTDRIKKGGEIEALASVL